MAILLQEEGMKTRTQLYATDFNEQVLDRAREGIYPLPLMRQYGDNYRQAGGLASLSDYYLADETNIVIRRALRQRVLFSPHNLVTDGVFGEMHLILCRNVLIYFNSELQNRVLQLFYDSLRPGGFLCLGSKEYLAHSPVSDLFEVVADEERIYRKRVARHRGRKP